MFPHYDGYIVYRYDRYMFDIRRINGQKNHAPCQLATPNMEEQKKASELEDQLLEERLRCDETVIGGWPYGCGPFQQFDKKNFWKKA